MTEHQREDAARGAEASLLIPTESIALTVALDQVLRGDTPTPNVAAVCVLALARIDGRHDWTGLPPLGSDERPYDRGREES